MVDDPNRKSLRQFQCRDYLWRSFEELGQELECSVDYLLNEAMRHYLRTQGRPMGARAPGPVETPAAGGDGAASRPQAIPSIPSLPRAAAAPQPAAAASHVRIPAMPSAPAAAPAPTPAPPSTEPASPAAVEPAAAQEIPPAAVGTLLAHYAGQSVEVAKDEFFIGRGQKSSDLVIRDNNVSRQHARVVKHQGSHWIVDNQSTNGIEYGGVRIQQRRIESGDVFTICGHEIRFEYR